MCYVGYDDHHYIVTIFQTPTFIQCHTIDIKSETTFNAVQYNHHPYICSLPCRRSSIDCPVSPYGCLNNNEQIVQQIEKKEEKQQPMNELT